MIVPRGSHDCGEAALTRWPTRSAFTLIELIVCVGLLALLIGLLLPSLAAARSTARMTQSTAQLYQVLLVVQQYRVDSRGVSPFADPEVPLELSPRDSMSMTLGSVFRLASKWPLLMVGRLSNEELERLITSPGAARISTQLTLSSYAYSNSFVADPRLWRANGVPALTMIRATNEHEVRWPAEKVHFWDQERAWERVRATGLADLKDRLAPVGYFDGHCGQAAPSASVGTVINPLNLDESTRSTPWHNTADGVRGQDARRP